MFMKEQLYLLKTSINESNVNKPVEKAKIIEFLQHRNQNLVEENTSKITIIKILAENQISHNFSNFSKSTLFEKLTKGDSKFREKRSQQRKHLKIDLTCNIRYFGKQLSC